jgi:hypothetical protein
MELKEPDDGPEPETINYTNPNPDNVRMSTEAQPNIKKSNSLENSMQRD